MLGSRRRTRRLWSSFGVLFRLRALPGLGLAIVALGTGCAAMDGTPSLTVLSRSNLRAHFEPVAEPVEERQCLHQLLFVFLFGNANPTHEAVIADLLDRYDADVLLDAEVTTVSYPFGLYNRFCRQVRGQPARRRAPGEGA